MHELSQTQNILMRALQNAGDKRVLRVNLLVDTFLDEREELIRFCWSDLAKNTIAQNAELCFQPEAAEMKCLACGTTFRPDEETSLCPHCSRYHSQWLKGDDLRLESIEVEQRDSKGVVSAWCGTLSAAPWRHCICDRTGLLSQGLQ